MYKPILVLSTIIAFAWTISLNLIAYVLAVCVLTKQACIALVDELRIDWRDFKYLWKHEEEYREKHKWK